MLTSQSRTVLFDDAGEEKLGKFHQLLQMPDVSPVVIDIYLVSQLQCGTLCQRGQTKAGKTKSS